MVGFRVWAGVLRARARVSALSGIVFALAGGCAGQSTGDGPPDQCPGVCAKAAKCPGAPPFTQSCDDTCLEQDALAADSDCHDQYVASINCSAKLADVCTALTACATEVTATTSCEQKYCAAHPTSDVCVN
jgi:hypothetical protein